MDFKISARATLENPLDPSKYRMKNFKTWLVEDWRPSLEFPNQGTEGKVSFTNHVVKPLLRRFDLLRQQINPDDGPAVANAREDIKNYLIDLRNKSFGGFDVSDADRLTPKTYRPITSQPSFNKLKAQLVAQGMSPEEAHQQAWQQMGEKRYGHFMTHGKKTDAYKMEPESPVISFRKFLKDRNKLNQGPDLRNR